MPGSAKLYQITPGNTASPEASSLGKYVNYPVNYGTGLVDINIPLYEIKAGDLVLPISLSYHASGIKVNQAAGWIGLGWTLNAEPSISRSIQGRPDDNGLLLNTANADSYWQQYLISLVNGDWDEEPDEFYYKLLSRSGGFYFKKQPRTADPFEIVTLPFEPLKITYTNSTPNRFDIVDDKGVYYRFGTSLYGTQYIEDTQKTAFTGTTSWKATEIISGSGRDTISFNYHPFNTAVYYNHNDRVSIEDKGSVNGPGVAYWNNCTGASVPFVKYMTSGGWQGYSLNSSNQLQALGCAGIDNGWQAASTVRERKLSQISFANGKLIFEKDGYNNLSSIKVYQYTTTGPVLLKEFRFFQSASVGQRFQLNQLQILNAAGVIVEKYTFGYNSTPLPAEISKSTDHWGYYNGTPSSTSTSAVPVTTISAFRPTATGGNNFTFSIGGANKEPNLIYTQAGILTSITYPTGGATLFEYESNKYRVYDIPSAQYILKTGGGLRISKIKEYDPAGTMLVRGFRYGKEENGAGIIKYKLSPDDYMFESENYYMSTGYTAAEITRMRMYSSNSLSDLFFSGGAPIVYNEVAEYRATDGTLGWGNYTGKTVYKYNYFDSGHLNPPRIAGTTITTDPKMHWMEGQLLSKEDFTYFAALFTPIQRKSYKYSTSFNIKTLPVGKAYRKRNVLGTPPPPPTSYQFEDILYHQYNIESGAHRITSDTTIVMDGTNPVITVNNYTYGNLAHLYPTAVQTTVSNGETIQTYHKYPQDITLSGAEETARLQLVSDWRINTLLEETRVKGGKTLTTRNDYKVSGGLAVPSAVKTNTGAGGTLEDRLQYHTHSQGRVTSVSMSGGPKVCYLYSYRGTYPIAEIKNAEYSTIQSLLGGMLAVENFSNKVYPTPAEITTFLAPLRAQLTDALITSYTYKPLAGMTSMTDPKGLTTYYDYDNFQRLEHIRDHNQNILKSNVYHYKP